MITRLDIEQGSEEWHEGRKDKVTGSHAVEMLVHGVDDAKERNNASDKFRGNYYTNRGHVLEKRAIDLYEKITKREVTLSGTVVNSKYPNAQCSPDGEDEEIDALLEVKCLSEKKHLENIKYPDVKYVGQANYNAVICGRSKALLVFLCPTLAHTDPKNSFVVKNVTNKKAMANIKRRLAK